MNKARFQILYLCLSLVLIDSVLAQEYEQLHMLRLKQENDLYQYWHQSDKNFSDGWHIEVAHRIFDNKPADWFLIGFGDTRFNDFSLSLGQDIFTPSNIDTTEIIPDDRPYSGLFYFSYSKYSNRFLKGSKIQSNFYLGLQGPGAYGKEVQNGVHEQLGNASANGWDNQLGQGLMLDYDFRYTSLLPLSGKWYETAYFGKAHFGSIFNYVGAGIDIKFGHYTDTYMNYNGIRNRRNTVHVTEQELSSMSKRKKKLLPKAIRKASAAEQVRYINERMNRKFQVFVRLQIEANYTIYDGTVEGSLISFEEHPHTLATRNEDPFLFQGEYSIDIQYGRFMAAFNRYLENDVVNSGQLFGFGEIEFSWVF